MTNFNFTKAFSFGILIWLIMFALVSALVGFGIFDSVYTQLGVAIVAGVLAYAFASSANPHSATQALSYGSLFVAVGLVLDFIISRQFNSGIFGMFTYWVGYALMLFAPTLRIQSEERSVHQAT